MRAKGINIKSRREWEAEKAATQAAKAMQASSGASESSGQEKAAGAGEKSGSKGTALQPLRESMAFSERDRKGLSVEPQVSMEMQMPAEGGEGETNEDEDDEEYDEIFW